MDEPIVGRDRELAELRAGLVAAASGAGRLVLVGGDAGIGKTRLSAAAVAMAAEYGIPVARGHAVDDPGMPPLWPWRRLARDVTALHRALTDAHFEPADSATARFAMLADATDALAAAAVQNGLLVVLEDMHWADRTSLRLLTHLAAELGGARILVVVTYREADGALAETLPDLLRAPATRTIRLGGLTREDVAGWVRRATTVADPDSLAGRLTQGTGGNPLYLRMLLDSVTDSGEVAGHPELQRLLLARLDRLSPRARDLLGVASVLGERIEPALLAAVTGEDPAALLDEAVAARALRVTGDGRSSAHGVVGDAPRQERAPSAGADALSAHAEPHSLAFTHALVRDATYQDLSPSTRADLHRRCALALAATGGAPGRIATHWRRADGPDAAAECTRWASAAARAATSELAYDEALRFATLALASAEHAPALDRAALTIDLARAEFLTGDVDACLDHCRAAARLAQDGGAPELIADAALVITGWATRSCWPRSISSARRRCCTATRPPPCAPGCSLARPWRSTATRKSTSPAELSADALELAERSGDPDAELDGIHARHLALCAPQFLRGTGRLADRAWSWPTRPGNRTPRCGGTCGWSTRRSRRRSGRRRPRTGADRAVRRGPAARRGLVAPAPVARNPCGAGRQSSTRAREHNETARAAGRADRDPRGEGHVPRVPEPAGAAERHHRTRVRRRVARRAGPDHRHPAGPHLPAVAARAERRPRAGTRHVRGVPRDARHRRGRADVGPAGQPDRGGRLPARRHRGRRAGLRQTVHIGTGLLDGRLGRGVLLRRLAPPARRARDDLRPDRGGDRPLPHGHGDERPHRRPPVPRAEPARPREGTARHRPSRRPDARNPGGGGVPCAGSAGPAGRRRRPAAAHRCGRADRGSVVTAGVRGGGADRAGTHQPSDRERLVLSERTVETHVRSVLAKLGLRTRTEIAAWSLTRAGQARSSGEGAPAARRP